jgi:hypothetical protein
MENNTNYITKTNGYVGLLAAIVEQARHDAKSKNLIEAADAEKGIKEWQNILTESINFKVYE